MDILLVISCQKNIYCRDYIESVNSKQQLTAVKRHPVSRTNGKRLARIFHEAVFFKIVGTDFLSHLFGNCLPIRVKGHRSDRVTIPH